ncbi:helix-turn-helix domain-containing protein [uncultured Paraglaciecola sp.]|uniref:helix-turn-helix domain-containing protein n=1 Tax=uncultured Paraglaciecola sp. TaxID=1765024 RepID=UPI002625F935|nr:helix-turn-helix domain-containing protein [uncultured Paraglaciecola sp.]
MTKSTAQQTSLCQHCIMSGICFGQSDKNSAESKVRSHKIYHKSDILFRSGQTFDAIYILRSGSAKSSILANCGHEQISGFHYPGDLIGLDGFDNGSHSQSIKFLETSSVCRIGLGELDNAMANSASIRSNLLQGMSHALNNEDRFLLSLNNMNSAQRLSSFLLDLSAQFLQRGLSAKEFDLSMTRVDIANYLGMAIETVSRLLTQLQQDNIIEVQRRRVKILSLEKLNQCLTLERDPHILLTPNPSDANTIQTRVA